MSYVVRGIKLVSGEELVAKIPENVANSVDYVVGNKDKVRLHLEQPFRIVLSQQGITLLPWLMFATKPLEDSCVVPTQYILTIYELHQDVINGYNEQIGNIVTPKASLVLPQ